MTTIDNEGLTPADALQEFSDPVLWSRYLERQRPIPAGGITYYDARAVRNLGIGPRETEEELRQQLVAALLNQLRSAEIWAAGYAAPVGIDSSPVLIPADKWQVLDLDVEEASASGGGLVITGLRVFDSRQDATDYCMEEEARTHLAAGIPEETALPDRQRERQVPKRKGGPQPMPYRRQLKNFLVAWQIKSFDDPKHPDLHEAKLKDLRTEAKRYLERHKITNYPKSRSGLEDPIKALIPEAIEEARL